jgi:hypothetical protein
LKKGSTDLSDEKENKILVSDDMKMSKLEGELLLQGPGIVIESAEQLMQLAEMARSRKAGFDAEISKLMTVERALLIKAHREENSWRGVALLTSEDWGEDAKWTPPSNQLAGISLCEYAAKILEEDYSREPWN